MDFNRSGLRALGTGARADSGFAAARALARECMCLRHAVNRNRIRELERSAC